jgi:pimeloyl-ACP methyl ester carboxylesterase
MQQAKTKYTRSGNIHIAYQVVGEGPLDLIYVQGWVSHVEMAWEVPSIARFLRRLSSFSRLIAFDKRGTGLSDRVPNDELPTLEERMDDLRAVMDAVGSERAALCGVSEGGNLCALFAATYPERTTALVMYGTFAKRIWSPDYPWAPTVEERAQFCELVENEWGELMDLANLAPSRINDKVFAQQTAKYCRQSASPGAAVTLLRMNSEIDIRAILPIIRVPTLVINRTDDRDVNVEEGRWIASKIAGAKFIELPGNDHLPWVGDQDAILDEIQEFLTGIRPTTELDRELSTLLFTDIVGSTKLIAQLGDRAWQELLEQHHVMVREKLARFRGSEVDNTGDGFFASFDGPARAVRCALSIVKTGQQLGVKIRAGLHTGEIQVMGPKICGIAIHIGARVTDIAQPCEVLVSSTVKDLVAGSGIRFADRGTHVLKGVSDKWHLFAAT